MLIALCQQNWIVGKPDVGITLPYLITANVAGLVLATCMLKMKRRHEMSQRHENENVDEKYEADRFKNVYTEDEEEGMFGSGIMGAPLAVVVILLFVAAMML